MIFTTNFSAPHFMHDFLLPYKQKEKFLFNHSDSLSNVCNAPKDKAGVYLFYDVSSLQRNLIYVGCSGSISNTGIMEIRKRGKGGIYDRIVNGHQFGKIKRCFSIPLQMEKDNISRMEIEWYVTFDDDVKHSPVYVESVLLQHYYSVNGKLPLWNLKF